MCKIRNEFFTGFILVMLVLGCKTEIKQSKDDEMIEVEKDSVIVEVFEKEAEYVITSSIEDFEKSKIDLNFFSNKVFELAPSIEMMSCEISYEAKQCSSELITFDNDFYYVSYCDGNKYSSGGNRNYFKGLFEVDENRLILVFEEKYITTNTKINEYGEAFTKVSESTIENLEIAEIHFLQCSNKRILALQFNDSHEIGVLTDINNIDYIENFKEDDRDLWLKFVNL
ncbi:hypothetical protein [Pontimicrobium sp. IMCC45349]|uniref:hypothetical protein n=1 Tax=Pontimicrobium sp. IMCC45349 TaxID=3391574 RepID=UPI00399FA815